MAWQGFWKESKSFMCYDSLSFSGKLKFILRYPIAKLRFLKVMKNEKH